jgi:hypothetical protein
MNKKYVVIMDFHLCKLVVICACFFPMPLSYPAAITQNYLINALTLEITDNSLEVICLSEVGAKHITLSLLKFNDLIRFLSMLQ